jgi:hypothetical protein
MNIYQLTIDITRLSGSRQDARDASFPRQAPLVAMWTTLFGPLNQTIMLQRLADDAALSAITPPQLPQVDSRTIQLLDAPIRPFDATGGALHELRRYDLVAGGASQFMDLLRGILPHRERLSPCLGIWQALSGRADQVLHLWSYADLDQREAVRQALVGDPAWKDYADAVIPLILRQENVLLSPLPCPA